VEKYEKALIESLGSELQPLEMPGVALFTLVVGLLLTTFIGKLLKGLSHEMDLAFDDMYDIF
jgi:hypothetical protein